ncbi:hypothetical protein VB711_15980 [Cronbergia sp. UHCC 0137]|nr:hypothetical protein [Cronbergia sp. UHCC 0137]MEA5619328.1 hypothetical protein [Cronbergia sp. UHCC 0137]
MPKLNKPDVGENSKGTGVAVVDSIMALTNARRSHKLLEFLQKS